MSTTVIFSRGQMFGGGGKCLCQKTTFRNSIYGGSTSSGAARTYSHYSVDK